MRRKLVKQGAATLMVSLPSKWAQRCNLKKGNEVDILEKGKELIIKPESVPETKKISVNISELKHVWRRAVSALYKAGYDEIQINFDKPEEITKVYSVLQEFVGFEIINQTETGCIIKEIVETRETDFQTIYGRTFSMLLSIADDFLNALKNKNMELMGTIPGRDLIVNKYANFCRRIINKGLVEPEESPMLYFIIEGLETLGDSYKSFSKHIFETKQFPNTKSTGIFEQINHILLDFRSVAVKFDKAKIIKFTEKRDNVEKQVTDLLKTKSVNEAKTLNYLSEMLQILQNLVGPLLTLNAENLRT